MACRNFPNDIFQDGDIFVMCNFKDYPIPANANPDETRKTSHNIISALRQLGSAGNIKLYAFHDDPQMELENELYGAGFILMEAIGYEPGQRDVSAAMIGFLTSFLRIEPSNHEESEAPMYIASRKPPPAPIYVVIAKYRPDSDFYRSLKCLRARGMQIVLLNPEGGGEYMFPSVKSVIENGKTLDGQSLVTLNKYPEGFGEKNCDYEDDPQMRFAFFVTDFFGRRDLLLNGGIKRNV